MRVAFVSVSVPGHAYPMSTLARRLMARGHDVVFISLPDAEPLVRSSRLPFVLYCEKEYPIGSTRQILNRLSKLKGQEALAFTSRTLADTLGAAFKDLAQTLCKTRT